MIWLFICSKLIYSNNQLNEDNVRLIELSKNRPPPAPEPVKGILNTYIVAIVTER